MTSVLLESVQVLHQQVLLKLGPKNPCPPPASAKSYIADIILEPKMVGLSSLRVVKSPGLIK